MLTELQIHRLRGVERLEVPLAPLTILVGPNGTGKSTILDALLIGASPNPCEALGRVVARRSGLDDGASWLVPPGDDSAAADPQETVVVRSSDGQGRRTWLSSTQPQPWDAPGPHFALSVHTAHSAEPLSDAEWVGTTTFAGRTYRVDQQNAGPAPVSFGRVRLLDVGTAFKPGDVADLYTDLLRLGKVGPAEAVLRAVARSDTATIRVASAGGRSFLMAVDGAGVPIAASGDGIKHLVRGALELLAATGTFLYEEPENHLHPAAERELAEVIAREVKRGLQVILTTHSLELLDALLLAMADRVDDVTVVRMSKEQGVIAARAIPGPDAKDLRFEIDQDLR